MIETNANKGFISALQLLIRDSRSTGILLIVCTVVSLVWSNGDWGAAFTGFWERAILPDALGHYLPHTPLHWVNDGLMAVFFL
ncbi:MAG: Na(+)/H(+) antiporter NhaA, partial [Sphingobacteriales bacterium]